MSERRVLIVDDAIGIRSTLREMLEAHGVGVLEAEDGQSGLEVLNDNEGIGLVFMDMHMPGLSGLEVLERLRGDPRHAALPVVILTGQGSTPEVGAARELGVVGWLQKPVRMQALVAIARRYLGTP